MQVALEPSDKDPMGVPYGDSPDRKFWNLRAHPESIDRVPELADYPELKKFVAAVNGPDSFFATLGCEKWSKDVNYTPVIKREFGLYVDVIFNLVELAMMPQNYQTLYQKLHDHGRSLAAADEFSDLALVRVEPGEVLLLDHNIKAWKASVWVFGVGDTDDRATAYRNYGLHHVGKVMKAVSQEFADAGATGQKIFDAA